MHIVVFLLVTLTAVLAQPPTLEGYDDNLTLPLYASNSQTNAYFMLYWNVRPPLLEVGLVCETNGWCGFGFSYDGNMVAPRPTDPRSDAVVVWFDGTNAHASDLVITNRFPPSDICRDAGGVCPDVGNVIANCTNNAVVVSGRRSGEYLIVEYTRPLQASDNCDMAITLGTEMNTIYAVGPVLASGTFPYNIDKHEKQAAGSSNPFKITFNAPPTTGTTAPVTTTGEASTTGILSTTGASSTTAASTTTAGSTSTSTTGIVCPNLSDACRDICEPAGVIQCRCQNGFPSAECASSSSAIAISALLTLFALILVL